MPFEIHKLHAEGKAVAASTIRSFYLRKTTPWKKTIETIQRWIDEEKKITQMGKMKMKKQMIVIILLIIAMVKMFRFTPE